MTLDERKARTFEAANDRFAVVSGAAHGPPKFGGVYVLENGLRFNLSKGVCNALRDNYPRWKL